MAQHSTHGPTCEDIPPLSSNLSWLEIPGANYRLDYGARAGEDRGGAFTDITADMVPLHVYPTRISARFGHCVDQITTVYRFYKSVKEDMVLRHGGNEGSDDNPMFIGPKERVAYIGIWARPNLEGQRSLIVSAFELYREGYPSPHQFGRNKTTSFVPPAPPSGTSAFVGWAGRARKFIDASHPMYVVFEPPTWEMPELGMLR